jgi:cytosine/uracil/thiamine/allantoin permease
MPDFTRFGRSQREQVIGQVVTLPMTMSLFAAMGVMITSATAIIYGVTGSELRRAMDRSARQDLVRLCGRSSRHDMTG